MNPWEWPSEWFSWHGLMSAIGLLIYALGSHALNQRRHPSAAVAWVMLILLLSEAGVPLYLMFGTRKLPKAARARGVPIPLPVDAGEPSGPRALPGVGRGEAAATPPAERVSTGAERDAVPGWIVRLTAAMDLPPARAHEGLNLHEDGAQARAALEAVIDSARVRLDVCTFILGRDRFGDELLARLAAKARAGVEVNLLVDGMGTWMGGRHHFAGAQAAGVRVTQFAPPFRAPWRWPLRGRTNLRNHRKLVVADAEWLWCGGRNLAGEYFEGTPTQAPWLDLSFDLRGDIVAEAAAVFEADWRFALAPGREGLRGARAEPWPRGPVRAPAAQMLPSGPDYPDDTVHTLLLTSCYRARSRILAVTPYLVPDESLLSALSLAARRGVEVDLVVPQASNHRLADIARHRPMRELAGAGARLWLSPSMLHAKAIVFDDHMAMAGSVNLDSRSLFLNYELMMGFYSAPEIARFAAWIDGVRARSKRYVPGRPSLGRSIGEGLVLWLAFQL